MKGFLVLNTLHPSFYDSVNPFIEFPLGLKLLLGRTCKRWDIQTLRSEVDATRSEVDTKRSKVDAKRWEGHAKWWVILRTESGTFAYAAPIQDALSNCTFKKQL